MAQLLENHLWEDRVILLFASDLKHPTLQKQLSIFKKNPDGLKDRKLMVYQITTDTIKKDGKYFTEKKITEKIYKEYQPQKNEFTFILIGLDGGEKMRSTKIVMLEKLFGKIDQMPMRKSELKN